jgi:uncharacterized Zn finger protein (UPF0148 family)
MKGQGHQYDPATASRAPFAQISALQTAFSAAILAETNLQRVHKIAQQEVKSTHAFHTKLTNNMSVAKKTMQRHQARECWGCGSPDHVYSDRTGTIFCPRASEPEVKAKFDATHKDFQDRRRARADKTGNKKRKSVNTSTILASLMQDEEQLEALRALLTKKTKTTPTTRQDFITLSTFLCLPADLASKSLLPISVDTNLPHFLLPIGQPNSTTTQDSSSASLTTPVLSSMSAGQGTISQLRKSILTS